ncbi:MAG TPA: fumarylacetoacetate hydrolase family protein [Kofleriaceae bacterium]|nr:fumarylacetoacetate hydrolase family protein [Kofleriaceae bacterium]
MSKDLDHQLWRGQRPWFEIWFAVLLDESRRRALWLRESLFIPKEGDGRATTWGAWFDADSRTKTRAGKRIETLDQAATGQGDQLIRIADSHIARNGAIGGIEDVNLRWHATWSGGKPVRDELPTWLPAPTHAREIAHDATCEATIYVDDKPIALKGRAFAMHLWGKKRVPTLHWIWTPWLGQGSLEVTAVSLRDTFSLGLSSLSLDGTGGITGTPATAAHPHGLVTSTVAGTRRLVHAHAWADANELVGYAYRDTDGRDLMVAQSDIGSAYFESFQRTAPGLPWRLVDERRSAGGVAVEIHQRAKLPGVSYIAWDDTTPPPRVDRTNVASDTVDWPAVEAIVALGLTYADHLKETGQTHEPGTPPATFAKHLRSFIANSLDQHIHVTVPTYDELLAALADIEPGIDGKLRDRMARLPAVMDYEGEIAVVALGDIDETALGAGTPQPLGLAAANDLTARICQVFGEGTQTPMAYWACAKSFPRFLPVAPRVWAPKGGLAKLPELELVTRVNGEERQRGTTRDLLYDLSAIVRAARQQLGRALHRGDVILTGTPAGVGLKLSWLDRKLARFVTDRFKKAEYLVSTYATSSALMRPGDVVEVDAGPAGRVRARLVV